MARAIHKLTADAAETISNPGRHGDGGGLYLSISADGRRRWVFLFTRRGKIREAGLGAAGAGGVSLEEARKKAAEGRALVRAGIDPVAEWHDAKSQGAPSKDDDLIIAWIRGREKLHPGVLSPGSAALARRLRSGEPLGERVIGELAKAVDPRGTSLTVLKPQHRRRGRPHKSVRVAYEKRKDEARVNARSAAEAAGGRKPKRHLVVEEAAREAGRGRSTVYASLKTLEQDGQARELDE
jgi:Arm DNA-binding domain